MDAYSVDEEFQILTLGSVLSDSLPVLFCTVTHFAADLTVAVVVPQSSKAREMRENAGSDKIGDTSPQQNDAGDEATITADASLTQEKQAAVKAAIPPIAEATMTDALRTASLKVINLLFPRVPKTTL